MSNLDHLVDQSLRDPLAAARGHAQHGGRVIGYVGSEIPVELIVAADAFPLRLPSFACGRITEADRYLESSFMPDMRSLLQQYLQGAFEFLQAIIFPRSNDSAQRLYYYLSELRSRGLARGPEPLIFDLAKIPRDSSRAHSRASVARLAGQIQAREAALPQAIATRNRRRELVAAAAAARTGGDAGCPGSTMDRLFRAADFCDAEIFDAQLRSWLQRERTATTGPRVLLAGTAPPDERLHVAVEAGGANVVAELGEHVSRSVALPLIPDDGSFSDIADHYHAFWFGQRAFVDRAAAIVGIAKSGGVSGVVNWLLEEEDALIWDLPAQTEALAGAGIAFLALSRRRWDGSDGALEEISRFASSLGRSR
jgi:hypothetical protein